MTLQARDVSVSLGGRTVLDRLTTSVAPGELVAVVGPNGAGKSTALRMLAGLLRAKSGSVTLDDVPLAAITGRALYDGRIDPAAALELISRHAGQAGQART